MLILGVNNFMTTQGHSKWSTELYIMVKGDTVIILTLVWKL